jgi:hypothetical protein
MKRKSLNLGGGRSGEDMDKVIDKLNVKMSSEEEAALKGKTKSAEVEKARVTHYLSTSILSDLEEVYDEMRRRLPYNEKSKVKKSHIVDLALQLIVEDYHKKGDKSQLVKHFIK